MIGGGLEYPIACGSHGPIVFSSDGKYSIWGESGIWHLEGNVLTVTTTDFHPLHSDLSPDEIGKEYVSTIKWVDQNTFLNRIADGSTWAFRRCPTQD